MQASSTELQFESQTFFITQVKEKETCQTEVEGTVAEGTGLGYHFNGEHYVPTHLASGFGLGPYFFFEQDIQEWIEAIAPLTDWKREASIFFEAGYIREVVPLMKEALLRITRDYVTLSQREELLKVSRAYATQK